MNVSERQKALTDLFKITDDVINNFDPEEETEDEKIAQVVDTVDKEIKEKLQDVTMEQTDDENQSLMTESLLNQIIVIEPTSTPYQNPFKKRCRVEVDELHVTDSASKLDAHFDFECQNCKRRESKIDNLTLSIRNIDARLVELT